MSALGAERVLRGCPWLQSLGRVPNLGRALSVVARGEAQRGREGIRDREELPLRAFKSDRPPPLALLAEHCPSIQDVTITFPKTGPYCELHWYQVVRHQLPQ